MYIAFMCLYVYIYVYMNVCKHVTHIFIRACFSVFPLPRPPLTSQIWRKFLIGHTAVTALSRHELEAIGQIDSLAGRCVCERASERAREREKEREREIVRAYMHTYIHAYIHVYTRTYMYTFVYMTASEFVSQMQEFVSPLSRPPPPPEQAHTTGLHPTFLL